MVALMSALLTITTVWSSVGTGSPTAGDDVDKGSSDKGNKNVP